MSCAARAAQKASRQSTLTSMEARELAARVRQLEQQVQQQAQQQLRAELAAERAARETDKREMAMCLQQQHLAQQERNERKLATELQKRDVMAALREQGRQILELKTAQERAIRSTA